MIPGRGSVQRVLMLAPLAFLAFGCSGGDGGGEKSAIHDTGQELLGTPETEVAVVGGRPIRLAEVDLVVAWWSQAGSPEAREAGSRKELQLKALDHLIDQLLLAQEAQRRSVAVDDSLLERMLTQWGGQFASDQDRDEKLAARHMTIADVREKFRQDLLVQKLVETEIRDTLEVSDAAVQAYYAAHPEFFDLSEVHARHVLLQMPADAPPESLAAARALAERIRDEARGGADFAGLAQRYSDCPSKAQGGDLGFFRKGQMVPAFSEAAFRLPPGQVSDVVQTEFGFHVIKVEERRGEGVQPLGEAGPAIQRFLYNQELQRAVDVFSDRLRESAKIKMKLPA